MSKAITNLIVVFCVVQLTFPVLGTQAKKIKLRVSICCDGMCGVNNNGTFILYEDLSAEYIISSGSCHHEADKSVLKRKVISITQDVIDELSKYADSPEFWKAETAYKTRRVLTDIHITTTVSYKKNGLEKKNEVINDDYSACPESLTQLVSKAEELMHKAH